MGPFQGNAIAIGYMKYQSIRQPCYCGFFILEKQAMEASSVQRRIASNESSGQLGNRGQDVTSGNRLVAIDAFGDAGSSDHQRYTNPSFHGIPFATAQWVIEAACVRLGTGNIGYRPVVRHVENVGVVPQAQ